MCLDNIQPTTLARRIHALGCILVDDRRLITAKFGSPHSSHVPVTIVGLDGTHAFYTFAIRAGTAIGWTPVLDLCHHPLHPRIMWVGPRTCLRFVVKHGAIGHHRVITIKDGTHWRNEREFVDVAHSIRIITI